MPASVVASISIDERERDTPGVAFPCPEAHLAVRFGPSTRTGLDVHAAGARPTVHRKVIRAGQRTVLARLRLGAAEAVLGVPASALTGRIVALEELWGEAATRQLCDRLADTRTSAEAGDVLERAIAERVALAGERCAVTRLALEASERLTSANASVTAVASELGVSERHLRRVFLDAVGVGPKTFGKLARFERALRAARAEHPESWANIAANAGYYDQAHLIAEFRGIAGVTPQALLGELRSSMSLGQT